MAALILKVFFLVDLHNCLTQDKLSKCAVRIARAGIRGGVKKPIFPQKVNIDFIFTFCIHFLYSLVRLVRPNTEELISRPFMGLLKIRWLLQDCMRT